MKIGEKDVLGLSIFYATDFWGLLSHNQGQSRKLLYHAFLIAVGLDKDYFVYKYNK